VLLAEACRGDVDKICAKVEAGEGRVHECLREHRGQLTEPCRKEELKLEIQEASNFELRTNLKKVRDSAHRQAFS
jgi:golgi apparatus protein 1